MDSEPKSSPEGGPLSPRTSLGPGAQGVLLSLLLPRQVQLEGQVNEHLQGHLDNIYHLKQNLACTEERMAYLSYERAKEIRVRTSQGDLVRSGQ